MLLAIVAQQSWPLIQLDINNAFLNNDLEEDVYMDIPKGYNVDHRDSHSTPLVCKINNSLYGLRQAYLQLYSKFLSFFVSQGFTQSKVDYSLLYKGSGSSYVALLLYVDDIVISGASIEGINALKHSLSQQFKLKDLGNLKMFLGLEVARSKSGISIC